MIHNEEVLAGILPEPPDGTRLVVDTEGEPRVIWRDDAEAKNWDARPTDRWFDDDDSDPMSFYQYIKYAAAIYAVGPGAMVVFTDSNRTAS